ncbi:sugar phosphate isomerase/epimerase family protein [Paenibacillus sp.]|uniref:sugar phosphate isomerase/epimerase family protein n=1 Tax=Paenibacillus sp. TaxID=58172 RepID=UPI002D5029C0|nr:TIM barrel protein [Paenibacillus sp.]HZG58266.1 TIM barrel protein [Paenibacillus sp.]
MGVLRTGLLSITFRSLPPAEVVRLAAEAGLDAIEWGGDVHAPHGDRAAAAEAARLTREAGLTVRGYGSYYRLGVEGQPFGFEDVLASAVALGAPAIRVWAGNRASAEADDAWRERVTAEARRVAETAKAEGIVVCLEYHANTLTDTCDSAIRLLREADSANLRTLWQPAIGLSAAERLDELTRVSPWLEYVHAYYWVDGERRPFAEGAEEWERYLRAVRELPGERHAMLEFVRDDAPGQLLEDAGALKRLVRDIECGSIE